MSDTPRDAVSECLVMVYGPSAGQRFDLTEEEFCFGRDPECDIVLEGDHVSREHARIERDGLHRYITDLESTNGTYANDKPVSRHRLHKGDVLQIGEIILTYLKGSDIDALYYEQIHQMAVSDGLTGVANARRLTEFLEREFARSRRHGRDLSLMVLDLDAFSEINEDLGHVAGDLVLRQFAQLIERRMRRDELFARYGGEEFVIVLPESNIEGATAYAEILREMVEAHTFSVDDNEVLLTVSIGVSTFDPHMATPADLIRSADAKLYRAKQGGRNRVVI